MYKTVVRELGSLGVKLIPSYASMLKNTLQKSNIKALYEIYIGKMIFFSLFVPALLFVLTTFNFTVMLKLPLPQAVSLSFGIAVITGATILLLYHSYPYHIMGQKKKSIEGNLPFAITHMAAIASAGVPPFIVFKLLSTVNEYGEITEEAKRIVRNVEVFGMDIMSGMKNVAERTPSEDFKQFVFSIISTISTGGDLKKFFENYAKDAMFNYRIKRDKYIKTLSVYADVYTAVLIAAPLFFISILSIMALIGGSVFGLDLPTAMTLGVYGLIPLMNVIFITFIHYTQPTV